MSGAGEQAAGTSPAGFGTPDTADAAQGSIFRDPTTGKQLSARRINATTGRYEFDSYGRIVGDTTARQLIKIAFATAQRTSVIPSLGHDLRNVKDITSNFSQQVAGEVQNAIQQLLDQRLVDLRAVSTQVDDAGRVKVLVQFVDLTTGEEQEVVV